jgi:hypothetical protein
MRREIKRNIVITFIVLIVCNFSIIIIFSNNSKAGNAYTGAEATAMGSGFDLFLPILIASNFLIIVIGSLSVSKYWFKGQGFSTLENNDEKKEMYSEKIRCSKALIEDEIASIPLLKSVEEDQFKNKDILPYKLNLTAISDDFLKKIDKFNWKNENEKIQFINEMIALTPEEREEILNYMFKKVNKTDLYK